VTALSRQFLVEDAPVVGAPGGAASDELAAVESAPADAGATAA